MTVEVPASTANLGPGYDALALALSLRLTVTLEPAHHGPGEMRVTGEGATRITTDASNRFLIALARGLAEAGADSPAGWRVEMDNQIPLRRGLGSSAAATVAGILAAEAFSRASFGAAGRLALATEIEGHADNAAAALLGGFVVVAGNRAVRFDAPEQLRLVLFVPEVEMSTPDMRAALPNMVRHADAAHNVGQAAMVVAAMVTDDLSLLAATYEDRLHEPYRADVYPPFRALVGSAREAGAVGAALSGAGSSIIAFCHSEDARREVASAWRSTASELRLDGRIMELLPAAAGAVMSDRG